MKLRSELRRYSGAKFCNKSSQILAIVEDSVDILFYKNMTSYVDLMCWQGRRALPREGLLEDFCQISAGLSPKTSAPAEVIDLRGIHRRCIWYNGCESMRLFTGNALALPIISRTISCKRKTLPQTMENVDLSFGLRTVAWETGCYRWCLLSCTPS